jgi:RNA polymerase sigma-70 factor (ECF subfamily)
MCADRLDEERFSDDVALVAALRSGDRDAFEWMVARWHPWLFRLCRSYVATDAVALDVVQDTWVAVIEGIDRFEGRSSLRTWVARIAMNQARSRGVREARSLPFASVGSGELGGFDPDRFSRGVLTGGGWTVPPSDWSSLPEESVVGSEARAVVQAAIHTLPAQQAAVITLRDVEGWSSAEVRDLLDLSEGNQRVLLHRARSVVRRALDTYLGAGR